MQILIMITNKPTLRSEVNGWSYEDSRFVQQNKPIGLTPSPKLQNHYETVLHAIADGWHLIAPPTYRAEDPLQEYFEWWLEKDQ